MIIVCFHLHISYAGVEVQTVTPDNSSVEHTVEGPREVPEIVTEPTQFDNGRYRRSAVPSSDRWPNAEIPFEFAPSVKHNLRTRVRKAMRIWQKYTCVQFRHKRHNDKKWVRIQYGGCYSMVGMAAPAQALVLGPNCDKIRSILHELGHCMGLNHEHSRPDRDYYITVYRHRINGYHNFEKLSRDKAFTFGIPYDYYSIMHYHSRRNVQKNDVQAKASLQKIVFATGLNVNRDVASVGRSLQILPVNANVFICRGIARKYADNAEEATCIIRNKCSVVININVAFTEFAKGENHLMRNLGEQVADKCGCKETEMIVNEGEGINE
ncbi:metalloproteinase nas-13-like isoform X3 [Octopus vulgaris]|uniref:Metalloendopeptidase n=1 Tax=Octopus vulgaris TaxID=6645 RepID=A0AA36AN75_OCTVU|nr:metalloproteinase nas-13-like isoform X3 [Octopus vulgaris]